MKFDYAGPEPAFVFSRSARLCENRVMNTPFRAVLSPCVGICSIDDDGLCAGCLRTLDEIARWGTMGDDERLRLMDDVLPVRERSRTDG
jgi:predicted Fe-S protein YdhL (DUF1289 family)